MLKKALFHYCIIIAFCCSAFVLKSGFYEKSKLLIINQFTKKEVNAGCLKKDLIHAFGKPDKDQKYFFEMDEKMGSVVTYKKDQFYFLDGKLESFTILTSNFALMLGKDFPLLSIGHSVQFPKRASKQSSKFIAYDLKNTDGSSTDQFLEFDLKTDKHIEKIILGNY
ncbi:MAG: hypothetical protein ACRYFA_09015 [Janthinobacterium lividum]